MTDPNAPASGTGQGNVADEAAFVRAVQGFNVCSNGIREDAGRLEGALSYTLLNKSVYDGRQAVAFRAVHLEIQENSQRAMRALENMSGLLHAGFKHFDQEDVTVGDDYMKLVSMLNSGAPQGAITKGL